MSVTREEARVLLKVMFAFWANTHSHSNVEMEIALNMALAALRGPTREMVERMFPGCDFCNCADFGEFGFEITKHYAKICCALGSWRFPQNEQFMFCPKCGKPLTDEAVDMMLERWEVLYD